MPTRELEPYVVEAPRVEARRAMAMAEQVAVGSGRLATADHHAAVGRWRAAMGTVARKPVDPGQLAAMARASGIGFRLVEPAARKAKP
jgi:hypothetical protein